MNVKQVIIIEGLANALLMGVKLSIGLMTGSAAIISDAVHSLSDMANNALALLAITIAGQPHDDKHHYGHRKFEHLAVFFLAVMLAVMAFEIAINAVRNYGEVVQQSTTGLLVLTLVLICNIALTSWQHHWARTLGSDILEADAKHTLSDVLTTLAVIAGWQFAAYGFYWADTLAALAVAVIVLVLSMKLILKAVPVLVDQSDHTPGSIAAEIGKLGMVDEVRKVRARNTLDGNYADVTVSINPQTTTLKAHNISEDIERLLRDKFALHDVVVHIEPSAELKPSDSAA